MSSIVAFTQVAARYGITTRRPIQLPRRAVDHWMFHAWQDMIKRCYSPTHKSYPTYGGRGITVCDRWRENFWNFIIDMGERPPGLSLDRVNNDGPYSKENCRWASAEQQQANRRPRGAWRPSSKRGERPERRRTECLRGHPFDEANTIFFKKNGRVDRACRACRNSRLRAARHAARRDAAPAPTTVSSPAALLALLGDRSTAGEDQP